MHGLFPQSLMFSYSIPTWLFICLLILKLLIDFFVVVCFDLFVFLFVLNFSFQLFLFWLCLFVCLFFTHVGFLFLLSFFVIFHFIRDVRQPLSQIRLSLSASLGVGQLIFLAGVHATEHTVRGFSDLFIQLIKSFCFKYFQKRSQKDTKHISFRRLLVSQ